MRWACYLALLQVPPHFFARAQRNGVEPQRNALCHDALTLRPRPPLPTYVWRPCPTAKVSAPRTDFIPRPKGEGSAPALC